jgi:hypothetical protein
MDGLNGERAIQGVMRKRHSATPRILATSFLVGAALSTSCATRSGRGDERQDDALALPDAPWGDRRVLADAPSQKQSALRDAGESQGEVSPSDAQADDAGASGTVTLRGDFGRNAFYFYGRADNTTFDARGARWQNDQVPIHVFAESLRIVGGGMNSIWLGGLVDGTIDLITPTHETYSYATGIGVEIGGIGPMTNFVVDGVRVHKVWDGFRPLAGSDGFVVKNSWFSDVIDDCVEDDYFASGTFEDTLFDGCAKFVSASQPLDKAPRYDKHLAFKNVLVRIKPFRWEADEILARFFKGHRSAARSRTASSCSSDIPTTPR